MAKPKIRFKGYQEDWEQRKLGEVVDVYDGVHQTPDYKENGVMFLSVENISTLQSNKYISEEAFERDYKVYPEKGDILMTRIGDIGTTNVVESTEKVAFYVSLALLKTKITNPYFLSNAMKNEAFQKGLRQRSLLTAIPQKINKDEIGKTDIFLTVNLEEQEKIGDYFRNLDHLITLHQRKRYHFVKRESFAWEQRKLGDWGTFYYGRSCPKWSVTEDATIPCIRYGELYTKFGAKIDKVYSYTNMSPESLRFSKGTEVLIPRVGEDPMDYNHCTWLSMPDVAIGEMISVFNTENNPLFTATMFNATLQNEFAMRVEGGSVTNLYFEKLKNIDVLFPSLEEQEKIATYFDSLDHLITLHQRKCDETKKLKKYMLQKMFPQNGKKVPELRFSEFTDDWEQRKLGELVERITRKNQDLVSELPLTISAQYGLIDQNEFFDKRVASKDVSGYYLIKNGEFAYNKSTSTEAPWGAIKRLDCYENGVLSTLYIIFGIKEDVPVDSDFLASYYSTNLWHKGIHEIAAEGARNHGLLNIAPADFFETKLMIPQDVEEQKKIGKYFTMLEALITLHQRKYEELQKVKKFMLQNMFV